MALVMDPRLGFLNNYLPSCLCERIYILAHTGIFTIIIEKEAAIQLYLERRSAYDKKHISLAQGE